MSVRTIDTSKASNHPSSSTLVRACAIQMVSSLDWHENQETATRLLTKAARDNNKIAVLPENFITYGDKLTPTESEQRRFIADFSTVASSLNLWLVAGTFPVHSHVLAEFFSEYESVARDNRPYAASLVFSPAGEPVAAYTKLHLFDVSVDDGVKRYCESNTFRHGERPMVFSAFNQSFALAVCYDLRFAELFKIFHERQCSAILFPSAFTSKTGEAHWHTLVRARAIETQSYIVAANQGGDHPNGRSTWGESMIVDPWGKVIDCLDKGEGIVSAEIDTNFVKQCQNAMPIAQHRRQLE